MSTTSQLVEKLSKINVEELAEDTLFNKREEIADQQKVQMKQGIASTGKPFINKNTGTDEYSPGYARKKGKRKPIDLFQTGSFQNEMVVDVRKDSYVIDSADSKAEKLIKQFGSEIFGLDTESKIALKPIIQEALKKEIKKVLSA